MKYVLESSKEGQRLERQARSELYDPATELRGFSFKENGTVLDAGCGSGAVARYLAESNPTANVVGIDASEARIAEAEKLSEGSKNLRFTTGNLFDAIPGKFDAIVCRYVLEHVAVKDQPRVVKNLATALRTNGRLRLIDIDGYMQNIFPRTPLVDECLKQFLQVEQVDLFVGRKLSLYLVEAGFQKVSWQIQTLAMNQSETLKEEVELIRGRFQNSLPTMAAALKSESKARSFQKEYLELLEKPGTCLFYNKFIVDGESPASHLGLVPR